MTREEQLEYEIRQNQRALKDPFVQDKWVERELIERKQRELEEIRRKKE